MAVLVYSCNVSEIVQHTVGAIDFWELPAGAMYGRPVISNLEMDAVDTGGAELVA